MTTKCTHFSIGHCSYHKNCENNSGLFDYL